MPKVIAGESPKPTSGRRPAMTPEAREKQIIADAMDLAEKQIREGTASSQVITHFLKLGSMREKLERERLIEENKLLKAKTQAIEAERDNKALYLDAIKAMRKYSGHGGDEDDDTETEY